MIVMGLPKGRFWGHSAALLSKLGMIEPTERRYKMNAGEALQIRLLKVRDIPELVRQGIIDVGVAPDEWIEESGEGIERVASLGGYQSRLCLLSSIYREGIQELPPGQMVTLVTEFPNVAQKHFARAEHKVKIITVHGSAEALVPGIADFAVDCVETGSTAAANDLIVVNEIFRCDVHIITRPHATRRTELQRLLAQLADTTKVETETLPV